MLVTGEESRDGDSAGVSVFANLVAFLIVLFGAAFFGAAFVRILATLAEAGWRWAS